MQKGTVTIQYGASTSCLRATDGTQYKLVSYLRNKFCTKVDGAEFSRSYISGEWDGYRRPIQTNGVFPTGLLSKVIQECGILGYQVTVSGIPHFDEVPKRPPKLVGREVTTEGPYAYQWEAATRALHAHRGAIRIPTGGGKTTVAAVIAKCLQNHRTVFLVDSLDLLHQTQGELSRLLGEDVWCIGGGEASVKPGRICVATVQSLIEKVGGTVSKVWSKRNNELSEWLSQVSLLFADECHIATSDGFYHVIQEFKNAHYRFGLSATPYHRGETNTMKLFEVCGDIIVDIPAASLIEVGVLAKPLIHMVVYDGWDPPDTHDQIMCSYKDSVTYNVYNNQKRNTVIANIAAKSENVLILVQSKTVQGKILKSLIDSMCGDTKRVVYLHGDVKSEIRHVETSRFKEGHTDIVIATKIFEKGVDLPDVKTLILAGGGKDHCGIIQRLGRGMRNLSGKKVVHVYDFFDAQDVYMSSHTSERIAVYESEGYEIDWVDASEI